MDTFTVSSSGSSFCTVPTVRCSPGGERQDSEAASTSSHSRLQRPAAATGRTAPETVSTTIRKVGTDYAEQREEMNARAAALQRYKLLVRGSRLVPGTTHPTPSPTAASNAMRSTDAAVEGCTPDGGSPTRREKSQSQRRPSRSRPAAHHHTDCAAPHPGLNEEVRDDRASSGEAEGRFSDPLAAIVSDDTDSEEEPVAAAGVATPPHPRGVCPQGWSPTPNHSPAAKAAAPASVDSPLPSRTSRLNGTGASPSSAAKSRASKDRRPASREGGARTPSGRTRPSLAELPDRCPYPVPYENEAPPTYHPPEATVPVVKPSHPMRDAMRPNYEPVPEREVRQVSHTHTHTHAPAPPPAAVTADVSGTAGKAPKPEAAPEAEARSDARAGAETARLAQSARGNEEEERVSGPACATREHSRKTSTSGEQVLPIAGGSKTAFWVRPDSALYEMTASIAAKRRDHPPSKFEEGMGYARIDSGSHAGGSATAAVARSLSNRHSPRPAFTTTSTSSSRRSSVLDAAAGAADVHGPARSQRLSATPRGVGGALRSSRVTALSRTSSLGSHSVISPGERDEAGASRKSGRGGGGSARVADRQAEYFALHCSRLSTGRRSRGVDAVGEAAVTPALSKTRATTGTGGGGGGVSLRRTRSSRSSISGTDPSSGFSAASMEGTRAGVHGANPAGAGVATVARSVRRRDSQAEVSRPSAGRPTGTVDQTTPTKTVTPAPVLDSPRSGSRRPPSAVPVEAVQGSPVVRKRLQFDLDLPGLAAVAVTGAGGGCREATEPHADPSPLRSAPQATPRGLLPASRTHPAGRSGMQGMLVESAVPASAGSGSASRPGRPCAAAAVTEAAEMSATPSKSRRREHDWTASASPERVDAVAEAERAVLTQAVQRHTAALDRARQVYAEVKQGAPERAGSLPTATESRTRVNTNNVVASMLRGIVQQSRRVLPCYLCAELQNTSAYHLHVDICLAKTVILLQEVHHGELPAALEAQMEDMAQRPVPNMSTGDDEREAFVRDCYVCAKALLLPCEKCGRHMRVHDAREHQLLCGRSYYENGKAGQRVRETIGRIVDGARTGGE